ncbi:MAG: arginine--tRNA ligase [Polyangiaceae bacterium]|nr:arginine--tRNA ligase [Polyangiaceae bacterium]
MTDPTVVLAERFKDALTSAFGPELAGTDPSLRRSQHADYQANVALALKGKVAGAPRDLAAKIIAAAKLDDIVEQTEIAGPGFINLKLRGEFLARCLADAAGAKRLGVPPTEHPETVVIDYSSPNVAKEMHVGHIRSTIIGDALARVLEFAGHKVVRQNHLGDWGTQFGMLIEHLVDLGTEVSDESVADLNALYKQAREKFDASEAFQERARQRVVLLQKGDEATLAQWKRLVGVSRGYLQSVYDRLGVTLKDTDIAGESLFNPMLDGVVKEVEDKGLAKVDQGALCFFVPGYKSKSGDPLPLIIRKQDGGYGYATTDLAAIRYRLEKLGGTRLLYVVGAPQGQHLTMIYKAAEMAGWLKPPARAQHVAFGSVLGEDGKMFKTRAGDTVRLLDLIEEAEERALRVVVEKDTENQLDEKTRLLVAHAVGVGAIKYVDLSSDRIKDYVFDWKRMLATEGNSGPYLQYAHARACSILRKSNEAVPPPSAIQIVEKEERALALALVSFGVAIADVEKSLEPHRLCTYLYDLSQTFSAFFHHCPVLKAPTPEARASRLALCSLTERTLATGLDLLGIEAPPRM